MAMMCLTVETADQGWQETVVPDHIDELLTDRKNLLWLDICDPGPEELELLRHSFDFHELALEDVAKRHQRPKCDAYGQYDFIVIYAGEHTADTFVPHELQLFWAENYVVTIHQGALEVVDEARKRWQRHPNRQQDGLGYVIYVLFDSIMDSYFVLQDWVGERVEIVEEGIFLRPEEDVTADIFRLRKELLRIRRLLAPTGDVLHEVIRRSQSRFPARLVPYFADVQDHSLRVLDGLDTYRDLLAAA